MVPPSSVSSAAETSLNSEIRYLREVTYGKEKEKRKKGKKTTKQVFWYIATTDEIDVELSEEHTSYIWLNYEEAESMLTFDQEKELIRSAIFHMKKSGIVT